jgi:hypothetical protein
MLVLFGRYEDAPVTLDEADEHVSSSLTRWRLNLQLVRAAIYLGQGAITDTAYLLSDVLDLVRNLDLPRKELRVKALHDQAAAIEPGNAQLAVLAKRLAA